MPKIRPDPSAAPILVAPLPGWITIGPAETLDDAAFRSGAALAYLHMISGHEAIPQALWRDRLALAAAEVCVGFSGRREGGHALRDALYLTRPGDHPGPAGAIFGQWSRAVGRPISVAALGKVMDGVSAERIALCLDFGPMIGGGAGKVTIKYDPRDMSRIWVVADEGRTISVRYKDLSRPRISLWEARRARAIYHQRQGGTTSEAMKSRGVLLLRVGNRPFLQGSKANAGRGCRATRQNATLPAKCSRSIPVTPIFRLTR